MGRKKLQHIELRTNTEHKPLNVSSFKTSEGIDIKSTYTKEDVKALEHLGFVAGIAPNLRGLYSTMYVRKPWVTCQHTVFSTAEKGNVFYKRNLADGQKGLFIAFDLATHRGYDSDDEYVASDVGKKGVAIDSVEDMKRLFDNIPVEEVSITISGAILPIMAFYIVVAEEQGVALNVLKGTIQNDVLKALMIQNTYTYPPSPSVKIISDIFEYTSKNMPEFNSISISGYHLKEAGVSCDVELAYTLANGLEYIKKGLSAGIDIDAFAPRLSFFWGVGMNHFMEIAKMRAARMLWAKLVKQFNPKNEKSLALRAHCQTSESSLTEQDPFNNVARVTTEAMAAVLGGTQSLGTNALNETMVFPADFSERIARNTQLYLQEETKITKTIDPWAGSYYVEKLTHDIAQKAWGLIEEIEALGGMAKAIESGVLKVKVEAAAERKQVRIFSNEDIVVGVNKYKLEEEKQLVSTFPTDGEAIKGLQIERLKNLKISRDSDKVKSTLFKLTEAARIGNENLLSLAVEAARDRATLGEISAALEEVFGIY